MASSPPSTAPAETLNHSLRQLAERLGPKPALIFHDVVLSFQALDERAGRVAAALRHSGVLPHSRIAILDKNHAAHFELLFGAAQVGAVLVPLNYRLTAPELSYIVKDAGAELLFVGPDFTALAATLRSELGDRLRIVYLNHAGAAGYESWLASAALIAAPAAAAPPVAADPADVILQIYTSGTTGHPKGALLSHRNLLRICAQGRDFWFSWQPDEVCLVSLPLYHIGGFGWGLVAYHCGATTVLVRESHPAELLQAIQHHGVTKVMLVPAIINFIVHHPQRADYDLRSLRHLVYGASPMQEETLARAQLFFSCDFIQVYGLTETTGTITILTSEDHRQADAGRLRSCGRPPPGVELKIVDAAGQTLPPGEIGEIICRTEQVMQAYYKDTAASTAAIRDGWFYTGDAGYRDALGYLYICDRIKDLIISGGENIYPAEIESCLSSCPAVQDVAVIGIPDSTWGESVMAFVVPRAGVAPDSRVVTDFARTRLAGYKIPRRIEFVTALPRNASGKILRRELRAPYWQNQPRQVH